MAQGAALGTITFYYLAAQAVVSQALSTPPNQPTPGVEGSPIYQFECMNRCVHSSGREVGSLCLSRLLRGHAPARSVAPNNPLDRVHPNEVGPNLESTMNEQIARPGRWLGQRHLLRLALWGRHMSSYERKAPAQ